MSETLTAVDSGFAFADGTTVGCALLGCLRILGPIRDGARLTSFSAGEDRLMESQIDA